MPSPANGSLGGICAGADHVADVDDDDDDDDDDDILLLPPAPDL